jgi:hypothetical protein
MEPYDDPTWELGYVCRKEVCQKYNEKEHANPEYMIKKNTHAIWSGLGTDEYPLSYRNFDTNKGEIKFDVNLGL